MPRRLASSSGAIRPVALVMCGSFSPVTLLHVAIMDAARQHLNSVRCPRTQRRSFEVVGGFMSPVGDAYRKADLAPAEHRRRMLETATRTVPWVQIHTWEMDQTEWTRTKNVLSAVRADARDKLAGRGVHGADTTACMLVCGGDLLAGLCDRDLWSDDDIAALMGDGVVVMPREGSDVDKALNDGRLLAHRDRIHVLPYANPNQVSSTLVRQTIRTGGSAAHLVGRDVYSYIVEHGLYGAGKPPDT